MTPSLALLLLLPSALISSASAAQNSSQAPSTLRFELCNNITFHKNSPFQQNLNAVLRSLQNQSSYSLYDATSSGTHADQVYGMYQCRGDLTLPDCSDCLSQLVGTDIPQNCPSGIGAQIWLDGCYLRYENYTFTVLPDFQLVWYEWNPYNNSDEAFRQNRDSVLNTVTQAAPVSTNGYNSSSAGTGDSDRVYALAQCYGYVSQPDCAECLGGVVADAKRLMNLNKGGKLNYGSCYSRYEIYDFIVSSAAAPVPGATSPPAQSPPHQAQKKGIKTSVVVGAVLGFSIAIVIMAAFIYIIWARRRKHSKKGRRGAHLIVEDEPQSVEAGTMEIETGLLKAPRLFSFEELKTATNEFREENKLGEGGFGPVFKGTFEDGTDVAIKKLSSTSRQGAQQFLNEIRLINTVQHRNLVRLLGCCVKGSERLLVYEYLPKKSLDKHLFGSPMVLDWHTRQGILVGIAKGLAYLHEGSNVRIVHRDIKASNILLDDEMNPKIADFGLARLFDEGISHLTTRVAGTVGYLAPEYAMHGQLTEKADTFSFGLVALEILSGRRNLDPGQAPLLELVWTLYQDNRQLEVVDSQLGRNFSAHEIIRVIHVALLCVQMRARLRPSMSEVVHLLTSESDILNFPTTPAFIGITKTLDPLHMIEWTTQRYVPLAPITSSSTSNTSSSTSTTSSSASNLHKGPQVPLLHTSHDELPISLVEPR